MPPSRFPFTRTMTARFSDMDGMGHVNNAVFLTYFEEARMAYWMHTMKREDLSGMDMILARAEVDFRSPLVAPETIVVGVGCTSIGRTSFVLEQDMHELATGRLVAEARKVLVHYDYAALRAVPITPEMRALMLAASPGAKQG
jgi:acyl-CoA thioester hydrolase